MAAADGEVSLIRRALSRILDEANKRMKANEQTAQKDERVQKAEHATTRARRASVARNALLRKRLLEIAAKRRQAMEKLSALRNARAQRREERKSRLEDK